MKTIAREASKVLKGIVCTYKPPECSTQYVISKLKSNLCKDLNTLHSSTPEEYFGKGVYLDKKSYWGKRVFLEQEPNLKNELQIDNESLSSDNSCTQLSTDKPSYSENVLCAGPRYYGKHVNIFVPKELCELASGVLVMSINGGNELTRTLRKLNFSRCYQLKGILGQFTKNFHTSEKVLIKAKYDHVTKERFESLISSFQSVAQRNMFEVYGKSLSTQEAYDFAVKGLQRPDRDGLPIMYSLRLLEFDPPNFTLEVQCCNETQEFLLSTVHNLGVRLKCYATCSGLRCIRQGCFHVEHALVKQQWNLTEVIGNINLCRDTLKKVYPKKLRYLPTVSASDSKNDELNELYDELEEKSEVKS